MHPAGREEDLDGGGKPDRPPRFLREIPRIKNKIPQELKTKRPKKTKRSSKRTPAAL